MALVQIIDTLEVSMTRPYVQIGAPNHLAALRRHLDGVIPRLSVMEGVVGLTLNGGLSRGYADQLSEIDVTIFLTPESFQRWETDRTPITVGICMLDGQLYDIKYVNYDTERERDWEPVAVWDASYAEILYDPQGLIRQLLTCKLAHRPEPLEAGGLLMSCWWYYELAGTIWIRRGDVMQGQHLFNQAITPLVQALFVANCEYIPHEKWLLHLSRSLEWKPVDWESRLAAALSTGDMSIASLQARQKAIRELWEEIDAHILASETQGLPVHLMQKGVYDHLMLLARQGSMTLQEWQAQTGGGVPNGDPFHPLIMVTQGRITLDQDAFLRLGPAEMYAWHYAVLQAVRAKVARGANLADA
jgi:hypothetical protein